MYMYIVLKFIWNKMCIFQAIQFYIELVWLLGSFVILRDSNSDISVIYM